MKNNFRAILFLFFIAIVGCSKVASTTLTPTSVATIQATQATASKTPTEIVFPTLTSLPPMTTDNAIDVAAGILKNNGGCQLPCLFGLTPGVSGPDSVNALMEYFQKNTIETEDLALGQMEHEVSGGAYLIFRKNDQQVRSNMSYYYDNRELDVLTLTNNAAFTKTSPSQHDCHICFYIGLDAPYGIELLQYYLLPNILTLYGEPSKIMIASFPTDPNRPRETYPFSIVLYYREKGFLAEYISLRKEQGDRFMGCQPTSYINIVSWSPDNPKSLLDIVTRIGASGINTLNIDFFKDLEEATEFNIPEFYDEFKTLDESKCVLTPKELWPEPILSP